MAHKVALFDEQEEVVYFFTLEADGWKVFKGPLENLAPLPYLKLDTFSDGGTIMCRVDNSTVIRIPQFLIGKQPTHADLGEYHEEFMYGPETELANIRPLRIDAYVYGDRSYV